jgi:hypothetical protein
LLGQGFFKVKSVTSFMAVWQFCFVSAAKLFYQPWTAVPMIVPSAGLSLAG